MLFAELVRGQIGLQEAAAEAASCDQADAAAECFRDKSVERLLVEQTEWRLNRGNSR